MVQILLKIPERLKQQGDEIVEDLGYTSLQEMLRESLRDTIKRYKQQKALSKICALRGSAKNPKLATKEELYALAKEYFAQ